MSCINCCVFTGRLVKEPDFRTTPSGVSVVSFRIAVERSFVKQGEDRQADFIDIVAWRQTAEFVARWFRKGSMIAVQGSIQTRNYEDKQGNKRTAVEVVADNVSFCGSKAEQGSTAPAFPPVVAAQTPSANINMSVEDDDDDDLPF